MIEILAAVEQIENGLDPTAEEVRSDLESRFRKTLLSEIRFNLPAKLNYAGAADSLAELEKIMSSAYEVGITNKDCGLVKIRVNVEVELVTNR